MHSRCDSAVLSGSFFLSMRVWLKCKHCYPDNSSGLSSEIIAVVCI